jgi:hypothetical protein
VTGAVGGDFGDGRRCGADVLFGKMKDSGRLKNCFGRTMRAALSSVDWTAEGCGRHDARVIDGAKLRSGDRYGVGALRSHDVGTGRHFLLFNSERLLDEMVTKIGTYPKYQSKG